ncbi:transposon Tf2-9 polyprotein [Trichonephila clavipes]|nr:transposon Tf2-9 polyprotein [Trichonephila clavipes]
MGAVLTQLTKQGEEHPILYLSKKFSEVEKRYCMTEKECASIVFAIKRLHYYLDGNSFLVMTDHNPLVWLNRNVSSNPRLMRWALALQPYNFRIVHRSEVGLAGPGSANKQGFNLLIEIVREIPLMMMSKYFAYRWITGDEAHFWLNGYVNKQNCRIWSEANPQVYVETPLHPEKLTVWCALWAGGILLQKR